MRQGHILNKVILVFFVFIFIGVVPLLSQETQNVSESRKEHIIKLLNYRYKGGYYSFERLFNTTVEYPERAIENCIMGISIASFEVNCEGVFDKFTIKNALHFGINDQIKSFFNATLGEWNKCNDDRYTRFEVPIQFAIKGVETNEVDALLRIEETHFGYPCNPDSYFVEKATKFLDKKKGKKALEFINELIKRNPFNPEYYDMQKKAISMMK